jgi:hypothetical protein
MKALARKGILLWIGLLISSLSLPIALHAEKNDVMGKVQFEGNTKIAKDAGVWVDGQYVGYLKELKGSKTVLLLPGQHEIIVRQDGYKDFSQSVSIQPGATAVVDVSLEKAVTGTLPPVLGTLKVSVNPSRAAVFVDGQYVGHVAEFQGIGRGLLIAPGTHKIKIALAGYQTFETEIKVEARQKVEVKTDLLQTSNAPSGPLVNPNADSSATPQTQH